uniref:Omegax a desaturase n=1 Tax=Sinonovacula constricta TaxID=98310 RepID=A0AB38ZLR4_SINCO
MDRKQRDNGQDSSNEESGVQKKFPTIVQIKDAIPNRLFESSLLLSLYYVAKDFVCILAVYKTMLLLEYLMPTVSYFLFPAYWYIQGTLFMAIFVLGHDCGHSSFSRYDLLNDFLGTLLHTFVCTPYYPWKLSHKNHHKNTGNIDKDEVFYPVRSKDFNGNNFVFLFGLGLGWFIYLIRGYSPRNICHLNPFEHMFSRHVTGCVLSLSALIGWMTCLYHFACSAGIMGLVKYYVIPEAVFASWLLIVTFLHHIEEGTPWYSDDSWNYVKGQLSSVDRRYGWAHDVIHNIGTHQIHHLFSKIPHYHLEEATRHFRKSFPSLARSRDDSILPSMVRMFRKFTSQMVIGDDQDVHVYK